MIDIQIWNLKDPKRVQIQPSYKCNLECKFCWKTMYENKDLEEMDDEKWIEIVNELCEMNIDKIIISGGGEPLVRKDLISKIIKKIKDNNIKGSLVTNGTLLDENLIERLVETGWDEINFSLHSTRGKVSDFIRGKEGSTERTMNNIDRLNELKGNRQKPKLTINIVINEYNYDHLEEFENFSIENKIDHVILRLLQGRPKECKFVPEDKIEKLMEKIEQLKQSKKSNFHLAFSMEEVKNYYD